MPHWRTMTDSEYLHAGDLMDAKTGTAREYTLEIASVSPGTLVGEAGRSTRRPIVRFRGAKKPFGVNATNAKVISTIAGSPLTERWIGTRVTLYVTTTRAKGGEVVECIRIRPRAATTALDEVPDREEPPHAHDGVAAPAGGSP